MSVEPPFPVPPHLRNGSDDELHVWFTHPPGAIVQMARPQPGSVEQARWLVGPGFELLRERFPTAEQFCVVLDYRLMVNRDTAARLLLIERARNIAHCFSRVIIVPPLKASAVYRATLHTAIALVSAFGANIQVHESLAEVIARYGLSAAAAEP